MKMNRRQFLKMLGLIVISPLLKACDSIFGTPTVTPTLTSTFPPTDTPSPTETSTPQSETPTETPTQTLTETPTQTPTSVVGDFFSLHPFIEAHPEAVFIKRTNVPVKTDAQAKHSAGVEFAQEIFVYGTTAGIPLSHKIAIKANVTYTEGMGNTAAGIGIVTDRHFTEGLFEGMKGLGFQAKDMYLREGNWLKNGYCPTDVM